MNDSFGSSALLWAGFSARALGWTPDQFWRATPAELRASLGETASGVPAMSRADLDALMEIDQHGH